MKNHIYDHSVDESTAEIPRRKFLGGSVLGGLGIALGLGIPAVGSPRSDDPTSEECLRVTASDLLAMFSTLAWKLPLKLQAAVEAKDREQKAYKSFEVRYQNLRNLAKKLTLTCSNLSQDDPRKRAASELAALTERNVSTPRPGSADSDTLYLKISVLVAENRQVSRAANEILTQTPPGTDDNKVICEMLAELGAMDVSKVDLDKARDDFDALFKEFRASVEAINKNLVTASDEAAKAARGKGSKEVAIQKIKDAEIILDKMIAESTTGKSSVSPQGLKILLAVPRKMLEGTLPAPSTVTQRLGSDGVQFLNASFTRGANAAVTRFGRVYEILADCIWPSNPISVGVCATACCLILDTYRDNPPRQEAVANTLMSWSLSSDAKCRDAAAEIAKL